MDNYQIVCKKNYAITIEGAIGTNVWELFDEVQKFKDLCQVVRLDLNGTVVDAGIYETSEQLANSIDAVNHGNKEEIITNLPLDGDSLTIGIALELIDDQMKSKGFEGFSRKEILSIASMYDEKQLRR